MNWKEFFKPTIGRIFLFLILMAGINYYLISTTMIFDGTALVGLPFGFWPVGSIYARAGIPAPLAVDFSWVNFMIDAVFWYIVSCLGFYAFSKVLNK